MAMAQRRLWPIDDDPVSRAKVHGVPSAWRAQRTSPRWVCRPRTNSTADSTIGHMSTPGRRGRGRAASGTTRRRRRRRRSWRRACPVRRGRRGSTGATSRRHAAGLLEPLEAGFGLGRPAEHQRHECLGVVPGVGVTAREPRHHARGELPLGDGVDGGACSSAPSRRRRRRQEVRRLRHVLVSDRRPGSRLLVARGCPARARRRGPSGPASRLVRRPPRSCRAPG